MEIRTIMELGNSVLRKIAKPIEVADITSEYTQNLIADMKYTVAAANGVGLAAPQINVSLQVFIVASRPNKRYPNAPLRNPFAVINPRIINYSQQHEKDWEGCLSIPGIRGMVPRPISIDTEYYNENGEIHTETFYHFIARVFQHEYDHLHGKFYLDRLESLEDLYTESEYQKRIPEQK